MLKRNIDVRAVIEGRAAWRVKKHKEQFGCSGKAIPSASEAGETGEKYNEELFVKITIFGSDKHANI